MSAAIEQLQLQTQKYILNHDVMSCTADGVAGNHLYSARALGISAPWDIIQLHPDLQPLMNDIAAHYKRIGLSCSQNIIWDLGLKHLGAHISYHPSVFYYGPDENQYWGDYDWKRVVSIINSKNNFVRLASHLGVDVPYTMCFDDAAEIAVCFDDIIYPCYLKASISVAGVGIYRCRNQQDLEQAMRNFTTDVPVQIQEEIDADSFLNLQYRVSHGDCQRLAVSEQILDGFTHQGNRVPAGHEPWHVVDDMAAWLDRNGMKGIFAFDVAVINTPYGPRFTAIECNPRYNGATYPTLIAQKLGINEWSALTFDTRHRTLATLDLENIEYDPYTSQGVILVNWGTVLAGKLSLLLAGSPSQQKSLTLELESRL